MWRGREWAEWNRAADLMALTANCHKGRGGRRLRRRDFHPFLHRAKRGSVNDLREHLYPGQKLQRTTLRPGGRRPTSSPTPDP